jgi:hypothetical protein
MKTTKQQPIILGSISAILIATIIGVLWARSTSVPAKTLPTSLPSTTATSEVEKKPFKAPKAGEAISPVLLVGVDGFEWSVVLPLLAKNKLPHLRELMEDGVSGEIDTISPTGSPIIWTTIATGVHRKSHGIAGFRKPKGGGLYTSLDRKKKAFWNILSDYKRRVAVIGWWVSYPAEPVNGIMVAQINTRIAGVETAEGIVKGGVFEGVDRQVTPADRQDELLSLVKPIEETLPALHERVFGPDVHADHGPLATRLWEASQWSIRADTIYQAIAKKLLAEESWDLLAVYFGGPDVLGHRYWRYLEPERFDNPPSASEIETLGHYIPAYYEHVDTMLGELRRLAPPNTTFVIVSDHGMVASNTDGRFHDHGGHRQVISGAHGQAPPSFFVMSGPAVREPKFLPTADTTRDQVPSLGSVYDIAPTVLALMGIPIADDLNGKALSKHLRSKAKKHLTEETVPTHTPKDWVQQRGLAPVERDETERLDQLRELGYIE